MPPGPAHRSSQVRSGPSSGAAAQRERAQLAALVLHPGPPVPDRRPARRDRRRRAAGPRTATTGRARRRRARPARPGRAGRAGRPGASAGGRRPRPARPRSRSGRRRGRPGRRPPPTPGARTGSPGRPTGSPGATAATQPSQSCRATRRSTALTKPARPARGQVHGRGDGGVRRDAGAEQLVRAQPQGRAHRRVHRGQRPVGAPGQDRVQGAGGAQGAVAELGGEGGVPAGQPALAQQGRQGQVRVRVALLDRAEQVVRGPPGRVGVPPRGRAGRARDRGRPRRPPPRPAPAARSRRSPGRGAEAVSGARRAPRAQSGAAIGRLPGAWTSPSSTGAVPVPTSTRRFSTRSVARRQRRHVRHRQHRPQLEPVGAVLGPRAGRGRARPDQPVDPDRRRGPVHPGVLDGHLRRQRDAVRRLRRGPPACRPRSRRGCGPAARRR